MSEELKSCPFCGEPGEEREERGWYACSNKDCPAWHLQALAEDWNTRAAPPQPYHSAQPVCSNCHGARKTLIYTVCGPVHRSCDSCPKPLDTVQGEVERMRGQNQDLIMRNKVLRERPDLPADRIQAHAKVVHLQQRLATAEQLLVRAETWIPEESEILTDIQAYLAASAKCDGNHGGPRCADPECWNDTPKATGVEIDAAIERVELLLARKKLKEARALLTEYYMNAHLCAFHSEEIGKYLGLEK